MNAGIAAQRLTNQCITAAKHRRPADVVAWFGAVQAQEYEPAKWGLGLRLPEGTADADIERAFEQGQILRTHVMRPTWHFVTPKDIRWLLELTAPRVHRVMSSYNRQLELDSRTLTRGTRVLERALRDGRFLTRAELWERLGRAKLAMSGQRLAHLVMYAELEGVICSGPRRGKQSTYALLAERAPNARRLGRDESLALLTRRYFRSHGPATIRDFAWWSGLVTADAKRGLEMNRARREDVAGRAYWSIGATSARPRPDRAVRLLQIYDEYVVAYRDRDAIVDGSPAALRTAPSSPVSFRHAVVIAGHIAGTWRTARKARSVSMQVTMLRRTTAREQRALAEAAEHYGRFLGTPVEFTVT